MLDRVPVPTDNIYKFIALFSLVALIFSAWQMLSITAAANEVALKIYPEIEELKSIDTRSRVQEAKLVILERQLEVVVEDRRTLTWVLTGIVAFACFGIIYGFGAWHYRVQPLVDAHNRAQLELLLLQVEKLKLENQRIIQHHALDENVHNSVGNVLMKVIKTILPK